MLHSLDQIHQRELILDFVFFAFYRGNSSPHFPCHGENDECAKVHHLPLSCMHRHDDNSNNNSKEVAGRTKGSNRKRDVETGHFDVPHLTLYLEERECEPVVIEHSADQEKEEGNDHEDMNQMVNPLDADRRHLDTPRNLPIAAHHQRLP